MINRLKKVALYIVPFVLLMIMVLHHIENNALPKIFGDEYGYWAAGSYFAGLDWNEITALNNYYGWGYGLVLSFILRLPIPAEVCYKLAIGLNGIFLCLIYIIVYKLSKTLIQCEYEIVNAAIAFTVTIMPSTLYYTQYTMSEVILALCYWSVIYLAWKILEENSWLYELLFVTVNAFMLSIHLRAIGIVLVSAILLIFVHIKQDRRRIKRLFFSVAILIAFLVLVNGVKGIYRDSYANSLIELNVGNDTSGQIGKLHYLFTKEGFINFLQLFAGRLYSMVTNSCLFAACAISYCIGSVMKSIKNRKWLSTNDTVLLFAVLCILVEIAISALFMIDSLQGRFDILTYSRYHEFTVGVLILYGFKYGLAILNQQERIRSALVQCIFFILLVLIVLSAQNYEIPSSHDFIHNPSNFYWINHASLISDTFMLAMLCAVLLYIFYQIILSHNDTVGTLFMCISMVMFTIISSNYIFTKGCLSWSVQEIDNLRSIEKFIFQNNYENSLYFLTDDDVLKVDGLQFKLKNNTIHIISKEQIAEQENRVIVTSMNYDESELLQNMYEKVYQEGNLELWSN